MIRQGGGHGVQRFEWDAFGRLASFENTQNERWAYRYDALGRRIGKRATDAWHGKHSQHGSQTWFLWDGDAMAGELRRAANKQDSARFYAYHLGSFEPLAMQTKEAASKRLYFYQNDPNGAPVRLRNANGEIVWEVHYGVTGGVDHVGTERIEQPIRLQGQYEDYESRLRYNRHRYFDPQTGIFVSQDPIGLAGGVHPYRFGPNTSGWIDPLGLTELVAFDPLPDGTQVFRIGSARNPFGFDFSGPELAAIEKGRFNGPPGISVIRAGSADEAREIWNRTFPQNPATRIMQASAEEIRVAGFDVIHNPSRNGLGDSHARLIHPDGPDGHNANRGNLMQVFKCGGGG
ncbi:RHS repeat-associated core domain-containing protein [Caballeronia sp. LZ034LL]|uniref:RHS repeat domain-containing protein n=1 Tax=Caballeronia sp. LZ034LL TaxID=3038567 RepID=UPI0028677D8D|nr:RHS repeat-associated core domain-containing protein [Caballeronia sp. LZ034LL]MDR5837008.1 RHS repeat-associated core domain-containing protein [Caballeronia sp. LZ034LL]